MAIFLRETGEAGENITNIESDDANDEQQHQQVYCSVQGCKSRKVSRAR